MGGAVRHPGNVSPLAEANFAHDARAARLVVDAFSSDDGDRLVIAPLDVTMAGAVDHALKQLLYPPAPHQWLAASGRDSPGLSDKDGDEAGRGELSTHWA